MGTHLFNDGTSGDLIVYTNPSYYKGQIGVILDEEGRVATEAPLYTCIGALHGFIAWRLARAGYLMPPETV